MQLTVFELLWNIFILLQSLLQSCLNPLLQEKKVSFNAVRSSRTSYRFHSLHASKSQHSIFQKGSKQSVPHSHNSAALRSAPFCSFVHTLFAFTRKLAREPLFGQSKEQCKHSQPSRFVHLLRSSTTLCGLPVSAGGLIVAVSTLFAEAAKVLPRAVNWSWKYKEASAGVAT